MAAAEQVILGVDVGGTFTDAVLVRGSTIFTSKTPSTTDDQSRGVIEAISLVLGEADLEPHEVSLFAHGMTVATNAMLENHSARTALVVNRGFTDLVEIGRQDRASLYDLEAARPPAMVPPELRVPVGGRYGPEGELETLEDEETATVAAQLARLDVESVAVCLLHADRFPQHELKLGAAIKDVLGSGVHVSLSHEVVGTFREYERAATTEVDAALSPLLSNYLTKLNSACEELGLVEPLIMQSSGGLASLEQAAGHAALTVLSGPAGGAAAASLVSKAGGFPNLLCFDMGGTSCDVCLLEGGSVRETGSKRIAGHPLALPMVDIDTVGAGGGSIAWRDSGGALRVGPRSAGADPGPACYGRGGSDATVTDANLILGRLDVGNDFAGGIRLDRVAAEAAVARLARELSLDLAECARGIIDVANAEMVRAMRVMTVERGLDPEDFSLLAFGGAGPLHAVAIAEELSITQILVPVDGGVFSALGLAAAERRRDDVRTVMLSEDQIDREALAGLAGDADRVSWDIRYQGQSFELTVRCDEPEPDRIRQLFEEAHENQYGYRDETAAIELVTVRRRHLGQAPEVSLGPPDFEAVSGPGPIDLGQATLYLSEGWQARPADGGMLRISRREAM